MSGDCRTKYPLLLIHGTGVRDGRRIGYWGRIPAALEAEGAQIFYGGQDAWATVEENAVRLKGRVEELLRQTGAEGVNLIAHSKGGLDARYLISTLDMAWAVASLTTVSTPHHGSKTMDLLFRLPGWLLRLGGAPVNGCYRLLGDHNPDFYAVCRQFTTAWTEKFNRENPDAPGVCYRSYAGAMHRAGSDLFMCPQCALLSLLEGENDGLVTPESARWTDFRPVWRGPGKRGISHMDEVDFRRRPFRGACGEGRVGDIVEEYRKLVCELREWGL